MTLATHGVVGSLVAQSLAWNPFLAIPIAFLSHFVLDAIPHWDYQLHSVSGDYNDSMTWKFSYGVSFISDCLKVGIDFIIGVGLSLVAFKILGQELSWVGWLGLLVAVFPDFFHFIYSHFPNKAINLLQRFHKFVHSKRRIEGSPVFGISLQGLLIFGFVVVFSFIL